MKVIKRDGTEQPVYFDKITNRIEKILNEMECDTQSVDCVKISQKICGDVHDGISTSVIDELAAQTAMSMITEHPDYGELAARIVISNLHKNTSPNFCEVMEECNKQGFLSDQFMEVVNKHGSQLEEAINYQRDYYYDYFGYKTLEKAYLQKIDGVVIERPQHLIMRVAIGIHFSDIDSVLETYELISERYFTHATPTLFNAGTKVPQLASCFLGAMKDDSIIGIYDTLKECARISKTAGGIGLHSHNIRGRGSTIRSNGRKSTGIIPMLKVFNDTAVYVDQGGRRPGSIAIYLCPSHPDIMDFLEIRKNHGNEAERCRDLFSALWIPDIFMERVEKNEMWSLMCPDSCPGLADAYGEKFNTLYTKYESEGKYIRQLKAQEVWFAALNSQISTGTPYLLYKDSCNEKSNQKNLGTIKCSNLCTEIVEYSSPEETAVCNLASICLPRFISDGVFNYDKLGEIVKVTVRNLNNVIDNSFYPVEEARRSNMRHRPVGIGVQGLADVFIKMRYPFDSQEAKNINKNIFETMYYYALSESYELAKKHGKYDSYEGCPVSQGILQFDMWGVTPSDRHDWETLRGSIKEHGLRNSLLMAQMPTASTSQIMGNSESIDPIESNVYNRRTMAGEFTCVNKHLIKDLHTLGLWNMDTMNEIIKNDGSIQGMEKIPEETRALYKTVWEISQKHVIDMAADRGAYICQSQSMNLSIRTPNYKNLSSMYMYGHKKKLKTGVYYLRSKPSSSAVKVALPVTGTMTKVIKEQGDDEGCLMCSS